MSDPAAALAEPPWRLGLRSLEIEHPEPIRLPLEGELPDEVLGTLYRNGPARLSVYGSPLNHWFCGDGMVHAFTLAPGEVTYRHRFVQTPGHREEDEARRRIWATFATPPAGGILSRFLHRKSHKSAANTHVFLHAGHLLALSEGGPPWQLDPVTLETAGVLDTHGTLGEGEGFSAHPKIDERTGELWNFTARYGREPVVGLLRRDTAGRFERVAEIPMTLPAMIHDFAITPSHAVVKFDPFVLPRFPLWLILGQRAFGQLLEWKPELGTHIALVPRDGSPHRTVAMEPLFAEHVIAAHHQGDTVLLDAIAYADATTIRALGEVMTGPIRSPSCGFPTRIRVPPSGRPTVERLSETPMELPRHLTPVGEAPRVVYGVAWTDRADFIQAPCALDVEARRSEVAPMGPGEYAGECVPVRKRGSDSPFANWLLTLVLNAPRRRSELRVLDGERLSAPPVATIALPHVVPLGFHGNFYPR